MKLLVFGLLVIFCLRNSDAKIKLQKKCSQSRLIEADRSASEGFFLLDPEFEGHNGRELNKYCNQVKESLDCVEKFNKECLTGFTKQSASMGINGMKKHYKQICVGNPPAKQAEFLQKTKWLTRQKVDQLTPCVRASIKNMNHISQSVESDQQIPQSCCNYQITRQCLTKKVKTMANEQERKYIEHLADETLSSLINFVCAKYDSARKCQQNLQKPVLDSLRATFKNPGTKGNYESYLIPFLEVLND